MVKWAPYSPKFKGPTQCRLCTMYGHGAENCNRAKICGYCASKEHDSSNCGMCPANASTTTNVSGAVFKCYSCSTQNLASNHAATNPNCPARIQYLAIRNKMNTRNTNKHTNVSATKTNRLQNVAQTNRDATVDSMSIMSYASAVKQMPSFDNNSGLFSMTELFNIFNGAVTQLLQCKSKFEQLKVVVSLLEYAVK